MYRTPERRGRTLSRSFPTRFMQCLGCALAMARQTVVELQPRQGAVGMGVLFRVKPVRSVKEADRYVDLFGQIGVLGSERRAAALAEPARYVFARTKGKARCLWQHDVIFRKCCEGSNRRTADPATVLAVAIGDCFWRRVKLHCNRAAVTASRQRRGIVPVVRRRQVAPLQPREYSDAASSRCPF